MIVLSALGHCAMDIQPLNGILNGIGSGGEWDTRRQLQQLGLQWPAIVGPTVAQHSRPLEIHNGILQVATSTTVWAQNLSFERRRILKKLNQKVGFQALGLREIRFSTAQWHNRPGSSGAIAMDKRLHSYQQQLQWQQHPSRLPPPIDERPQIDPAQSAGQAFNRWSQRRQQQVNQVPSCPQCKAPAPQGELERWGICSFCMTQHWQAEQRANQPDGEAEVASWKVEPELNQEPRDGISHAGVNGDAQSGREAQESQSGRGTSAPESKAPATQASPPFNQSWIAPSSSQEGSPKQKSSEQRSFEQDPKPQSQLQPITGLPPVAWPSPIPLTQSDVPTAPMGQPIPQPLATHRNYLEQHSAGGDLSESPDRSNSQRWSPELSHHQASRASFSPLRSRPQLSSLSQELDMANLAPSSPSPSPDRPRASPTSGLSQAPGKTAPQRNNRELSPADALSSDLPPSQPPAPICEAQASEHSHPGSSPTLEHQRQAAWSQAFRSLKSQEAERQVQRAELERRTTERLQQVKRKRQIEQPQTEQPQNSPHLTSGTGSSPAASPASGQDWPPSEKSGTHQNGAAPLSSGRARPLLKKQQP